MARGDFSGYQPLYDENGKRDSRRRYYNPEMPEKDRVISRRQYDEALAGKSFEQKARERKEQGTILSPGMQRYNRNLETYAKTEGKTIRQIRRDPEFMKLNKMLNSELAKKGRAYKRDKSKPYANDDVIAEIMRRMGRKRMDDYTALGSTPDLT